MSKVDENMQAEEKAEIDPYAYTKTEAFTSEVFKVEIQNLPKFFGIKQLKKKLGHIDVKPCKVKMAERATYAFVTFRSEEEREAAIKAIGGQVWKNNTVTAKKARPAADPALMKRKQEAENDQDSHGGKKKRKFEDDTRTLEERLKDAVTPLWRMEYKEQLEKKERSVKEFLNRLSRDMEKQNPGLRDRHSKQRKLHGSCCQLIPIKESPVTQNYRNKCEFTIGQSVDGVDKTIGFRLGAYKGGNVHVAPPSCCDSVPSDMVRAVQVMEEFCQKHSDLAGFDPVKKVGNWRQLTVRTTLDEGMMIVLVFCKEGATQDLVENEKKKLIEFIESKNLLGMFDKVSLYLEVQGDDRRAPPEYHHLGGDTHLYEPLLHLRFRISPAAFFQVNTRAAEVLYSTLGDWADLNENTVLLDVCCGTGTIGLTMAKRVKKVIGIEMCKEAVEDAKFNATLNNITNIEFHCGKAEDLLYRLLKNHTDEDVVAIVDPPRGGLHADVGIALRANSFVKRLIYVSCSPNGAKNNIVDLTRKPSRRVRGTEFQLIQAVPVDLFPLTPHYELVMLFNRKEEKPRSQEVKVEIETGGNPQSETIEGSETKTQKGQGSESMEEKKKSEIRECITSENETMEYQVIETKEESESQTATDESDKSGDEEVQIIEETG